MSVHIYVMPFSTYFADDYQTIFDKLSETMGRPGFIITPQGLQSTDVERPSELDARRRRKAVQPWVQSLREFLRDHCSVDATWDEDGGLRFSTNMGITTYTNLHEYARQAVPDKGASLSALLYVDALIPVALREVFQFECPFRKEPITIGSALALKAHLEWLVNALENDPRWRDQGPASQGTILTGALAELADTESGARQMLHVTAVSVDQRTPVIIES